MATAGELLGRHPTNPVTGTDFSTASNKPWTHTYPVIKRLLVHTTTTGNDDAEDAEVTAIFDGPFLNEYADDTMRFSEPACEPNYRQWLLDSEADGIGWFHNEISNVVLAAWARYPAVLQASHQVSLGEKKAPVDKIVDVAYSIMHNDSRVHVAIGEFKRGIIFKAQWQAGRLLESRAQMLSKELRGYKSFSPHTPTNLKG